MMIDKLYSSGGDSDSSSSSSTSRSSKTSDSDQDEDAFDSDDIIDNLVVEIANQYIVMTTPIEDHTIEWGKRVIIAGTCLLGSLTAFLTVSTIFTLLQLTLSLGSLQKHARCQMKMIVRFTSWERTLHFSGASSCYTMICSLSNLHIYCPYISTVSTANTWSKIKSSSLST